MSYPTDESERQTANPLGLCASAVNEVMDFCVQSAIHMDKRGKQAEVLAHGFFIGGIKDIPNELLNHGWLTAGKAGLAGAFGAALSVAVSSKIKWLAAGAKCLGLGFGGSAIAATAIDFGSKPKLQSALSSVWKSPDEKTVSAGKIIAETECGPEAFNWGLTMPCAMIGGMGGKAGMKWLTGKWNSRQRMLVEAKEAKTDLARLDESGRVLVEPSEHELAVLQRFVQHGQHVVPGMTVDRAILIPEEAFNKTAIMAKIKLPSGVTDPFKAESALKKTAAYLCIDYEDALFDCTLESEDMADIPGSAMILDKLRQ